jgi:hypothetical protein
MDRELRALQCGGREERMRLFREADPEPDRPDWHDRNTDEE